MLNCVSSSFFKVLLRNVLRNWEVEYIFMVVFLLVVGDFLLINDGKLVFSRLNVIKKKNSRFQVINRFVVIFVRFVVVSISNVMVLYSIGFILCFFLLMIMNGIIVKNEVIMILR